MRRLIAIERRTSGAGFRLLHWAVPAACALLLLALLLVLGGARTASGSPVPASDSLAGPEHGQTLDAARRPQLIGSPQAGSRIVARWSPRALGRLQVRKGGKWRTLGRPADALRISRRIPLRFAGHRIRAQTRVDDRWVSSAPKRIGPRLRLRGKNSVGSTLSLFSSTRGPTRWWSREPGERWRVVRGADGKPVTARRLPLTRELLGHQVQARVRGYGRWWRGPIRTVVLGQVPQTPTPPPTEVSPPTPPPPLAPPAIAPTNTSPPVVSGLAGIGQVLASTTGRWTNNPSRFSFEWQRSTNGGGSWIGIGGITGNQFTPSLASANALVRACVTAAGAAAASCSNPFGPLARGPAVGSQDDRLPVVPLPEIPIRQSQQTLTGASTARVDFFWSDIAATRPTDPTNPNDPAYDWSRTDAILEGYASRGITPIVSFYSIPPWLASHPPPTGTPVNPHVPLGPAGWSDLTGAMQEFLTALLTRYDGGPSSPAKIEYLEIWNEPNKVAFLRRYDGSENGQKIAKEEYAAMAEAGIAAAKAVDPDIFVLVGGLGSGGDARTFLQALIDHPTDIDAQAFSQHLYPADEPLRDRGQDQISADCNNQIGVVPYPSWQSLYEITCRIDSWKPGLPIIITEAGYTTQASAARPPGSEVTEAEQAQYLRDIFRVPQVVTGRVAGVIWFNFQGNNGGGAGWPAGLVAYADDFSAADNNPANWPTLSRTGPGGVGTLPGLFKPSYTAFVDVLGARSGVPLPNSS